MKTIIITCLISLLSSFAIKDETIGIFENNADVGDPKIKGSTVYDKEMKTYSLSGSGYNIWFNRDEFQYAYKKIEGNFSLRRVSCKGLCGIHSDAVKSISCKAAPLL